jgi:hypothetical protein
MSVNTTDIDKKGINKPYNFLWEDGKGELVQILSYWDKIKEEWEKKKKEFWKKHNREEFIQLLEYFRKHREEIEKKYEILWKMQWIVRKKFEEEYLKEDMLYSWKIEKWEDQSIFRIYNYSHFLYISKNTDSCRGFKAKIKFNLLGLIYPNQNLAKKCPPDGGLLWITIYIS